MTLQLDNRGFSLSIAVTGFSGNLCLPAGWNKQTFFSFLTSLESLVTCAIRYCSTTLANSSRFAGDFSFNCIFRPWRTALLNCPLIISCHKPAKSTVALGVLFRCKQYFNSAQLFKLYTSFFRPCLEYCSHIWGSSPYTSLLDRVESKAIRLIGDPSLTSTLDPLSLRHKVASLSLFLLLLLWSLLWWIGRLYSTSNGSATFHTAGNICPQLLCGTLQCEN